MKIGVIGGTGFYKLDGLEVRGEIDLPTPFGKPSSAYARGALAGHDVFFLARHGIGHALLPSEINHRANIFGFKRLGVECIISISAVGSLKTKIRPRDIVLPDQYFDRTKQSDRHTFFGRGLVAHVSFGDPTCPSLRKLLRTAARRAMAGAAEKCRIHAAGTYVCIEGPTFSTRAESEFYRRQGFDVVGMTSLAEAKLCREAEICYQPIAAATDYDCWHSAAGEVTVEMIMANLRTNVELARRIVAEAVRMMPAEWHCACRDALRSALLTRPEDIPAKFRKTLDPLLGKYIRR